MRTQAGPVVSRVGVSRFAGMGQWLRETGDKRKRWRGHEDAKTVGTSRHPVPRLTKSFSFRPSIRMAQDLQRGFHKEKVNVHLIETSRGALARPSDPREPVGPCLIKRVGRAVHCLRPPAVSSPGLGNRQSPASSTQRPRTAPRPSRAFCMWRGVVGDIRELVSAEFGRLAPFFADGGEVFASA